MGILNLLPSHNVVEINLSTGIRIGHMLAQHAYKPDGGTLTVDNGLFFRMSKANPDEVVLADDENAVGPYYLHYTEELLTHGLSNAKKYFVDFSFEADDYLADLTLGNKIKNTNFKLAIECDGYEFHQKTKEQVKQDNEREFDLKMAGYDVLRFSGTQIFNNPIKCAEDTYNFIMKKIKEN